MDKKLATRLIDVCEGRAEADLLVTNCKIVDVFNKTVFEGAVSVVDGHIASFSPEVKAKRTLDAKGRYLLPGLIDAHCHIESSHLSPAAYSDLVVAKGTTTVIADPHEICNVAGLDAMRYMLLASEGLPLSVYLMFPSCVPATPFEHSGAILNASEIEKYIDNPADYPDQGRIAAAQEPYIKASIITPATYLGSIMSLCTEKRGIQTNMQYLDEKRVEITYEMPLAEVRFDFYDRLKSYSRGYASFDYEVIGYQPTELVKIDILINGKSVDALAQLSFKGNAYERARHVCSQLKEEISRQQFKIAIQGAIGSQIIARETVNALRKDVLAKCYGGDITRKRKLLEKQKEGKKRMKMVGDVELPQSAFLAVLKTKEE